MGETVDIQMKISEASRGLSRQTVAPTKTHWHFLLSYRLAGVKLALLRTYYIFASLKPSLG